ncbi:MAG: HEAT repeat domain-containing protein [Desulfuromonadales bacterium]|nr:HEAT repeat domain-containing protein [Desulfuromonadales bacterium]
MEREKIDELLSLLENGDWDEALHASDMLANIADSYITKRLIEFLNNPRPDTRNAAALALRDIGDDTATEPLLRAINKPENHDNRSTMVYALENLNCSCHFIDIFMLALAPKEDVRLSALNILHEQNFWISDEDLDQARSILLSHKKSFPNDSVINIINDLLNSLSEEAQSGTEEE